MKRSEKNNFVQKLKDEIKNSSSVIVAHYDGLSVSETDSLRKEMRDNCLKNFNVGFSRKLIEIIIKGDTDEEHQIS